MKLFGKGTFLVRLTHRYIFRLRARWSGRWLYFPPVVLLLVGFLVTALTFLLFSFHFILLCEIPTFVTNAGAPWRTDESVEFWPYSITMDQAAEVLNNITLGREVTQPRINLNYEGISHLDMSIPPCKSSEKNDIIILVKSSPANFLRRERVRRTLKQATARTKHTYFLIGVNPTLSSMDRVLLSDEIRTFKDFIIGDFVDTYRNLTFKTMMGFRWVEQFCPNYELLVMLDDDLEILELEEFFLFLKDPLLYPKIRDDAEPSQETSFSTICRGGECEHLYAGYTLYHYYEPNRKPTKIDYMSYEVYPPHTFPTYITGLLIIYSKTTVSSMVHLAQFVPHLPVDDLFVGVLAKKLRIRPHDISRLFETSFNPYRSLYHLLLDVLRKPMFRINQQFECD